MGIKEEKLQKINNLIEVIPEESSISPSSIAIECNLDYNVILQILTILSDREIISIRFVIKCNNDDDDMLHKFQFHSHDELIQFIQKNRKICPNCDEELNTSEIQVYFIKLKYPKMVNP